MDGSLNDEVRREVKRHYIGGIVAAVLMVALGAVMLFWPVESLAAILWIIAIVFLVAGVYRVVAYIRMPYFLQQSFSLAIGILDIICSIVMLVSMGGRGAGGGARQPERSFLHVAQVARAKR